MRQHIANLDPKLNAYREDLAAASLKGRVQAVRYVEGERRQVIAASAPLRRAPRFDAPLDTEALFGETVVVFDEQEGWAWMQLERDNYVGYLPIDALGTRISEPTHRVSALRTYLYPAPDIKTPPRECLSLNALLAVERAEGRFLRLSSGGFVWAGHAAPRANVENDYAATAERFCGTPYLWGGRTSIGIDCSGLIQLALETAGIACPRDTYMQEAAFGRPVKAGGTDKLQRGDLVFWKGHVGIMKDAKLLIHANATHMSTTIEPLSDVAGRNPDPIISVGRPMAASQR